MIYHPHDLNVKESADYCKVLTEQLYTDWRLPTFEEMLYVLNYFDGQTYTDNLLWTLSSIHIEGYHNNYRIINLFNGWWGWMGVE